MKCSHGLQYEVKCSECVREALKRVSTSDPIPVRSATQSEKDAFWLKAFHQTVERPVY